MGYLFVAVIVSLVWIVITLLNYPAEYRRGATDAILTVTAIVPTKTPVPTVTPTPPPTFTPEPLGRQTLRTSDYWKNRSGQIAVFRDGDGVRYVVRKEYLYGEELPILTALPPPG